ncbi:uncharacterized protein [Macrobrachium rosenbergii]|uniref:uncharacterized protein n=1 Tax=Macrobrachium rosenbergii TaxID=79674 RepID=UPI0034D75C34
MKLVKLYPALFLSVFFVIGKSSEITLHHGSIVEEMNNFFLTDSNIVLEVNMNAIFTSENDVLALKSELTLFAQSLEGLHKSYLSNNDPTSPNQVSDMVNMLFWELRNKTCEAEILARDLLMWSMPHEVTERRNPLVLAALNLVGSVAGLGLGISNRLKIRDQGVKIENLDHQQEVLAGELNRQIQALNGVISKVNEQSRRFNQVHDTQVLLATLMYYHAKIDHVSSRVTNFIEKSKDYVEAITLAAKGVLSPHLLPIKDLAQIISNAHDRMRYVPVVAFHKIEFYYSLITVKVDLDKIVIDIPFNPSDAWKAYKISPFPTYVSNFSTPIINNLSALVLVSANEETFTVVRDQALLNDCYDVMDNVMCRIDLFEFRNVSNMSLGSCELDLVLNRTSPHTREHCLDGLVRYNDNQFRHRLLNGTAFVFSAEAYIVVCPDGTRASGHMFVVNDGCTATTSSLFIRAMVTIVRGRNFFINTSWGNTRLQGLTIPYSRPVENAIATLDLLSPLRVDCHRYVARIRGRSRQRSVLEENTKTEGGHCEIL